MTVDQELARLRQLAENLDIQLQIRGNAELVRIDWMQNDGERGAGYWKHGIYRNAETYDAAVEIQNHEEGTADLSARILNPLPIDRGTQNLNLTFGQQTIDPTLLLRPLVKSIYY